MRLSYSTRNLIGVVGLQGTGKSTLLLYLDNWGRTHNKKTVYIKWTRDWLFKKMDELHDDEYRALLNFELMNVFESYGHAIHIYPPLKHVPTLTDIGMAERNQFGIGEAEALLLKGRVKELRRKAVLENLQQMDVILIDMPDYTKMDKRVMASDKKEIQEFWHNVQVEAETNVAIVITFQKELFGSHFFDGKVDVVEIDLLKPPELVAAYKLYWQDSFPFTEEALLKIAELSRGVFRRFLKYLKLSLETAKLQSPITVDHVKAAVSFEQQLGDMDLDAPKPQAVAILNLLQGREEVNQKEIAETLRLTEITVSRIIRRLEEYNYIKRKRSSHGQWLVSLK
jgi:DNA-binding MarR family transcriptional regulator